MIAFGAGIMAACAIAALVHLLVSRQERRCSSNVHEIGSRLFAIEAHLGISSKPSGQPVCAHTWEGLVDERLAKEKADEYASVVGDPEVV